ncbi:TonB-dependent receptor [Flavobacterium akiainvivens]|uniref:TonB-dependent receptor n=1 Tax=Flavobacterium akiainvivens TaxID=1202724 RepID=A0A0M8MGN9_9FLAO|nr:outer membrane beta-barrel family protein [Flavobacterium akiainvivens]KOS05397.1 TonB-dependent receptor [Flavobacterium akiainvivens]SFQ73699.1 Outer membrane receptor proteins, mostly Fe transport [Flavobacterium akiainvivens]
MKKSTIIYLALLMLCFYQAAIAQVKEVTISGTVTETDSTTPVAYANAVIKSKTNTVITTAITNEEGSFTLSPIPPGNYLLEIRFMGYKTFTKELFVGTLSEFLNIGKLQLTTDAQQLDEVVITARQDEIGNKLDKKTFTLADNIAQSGGSVLQAMQNLPGVTAQDGKVQLRGNDKVMILIDGKQTALTGFNAQSGLDNLPASAIEKIEIINNPSSKYDANGNAGIINIILKKNKDEGLNGKVGLASGLGALWQRKGNLPTIRPQYQFTPKINPSLSLNYRKEKINIYFQGDYLYTETLNKNEFVTRTYDDGTIINQQTKRNRNTHFTNLKTGIDWNYNDNNTLAFSALFGSEKIIDNGDEPFFNADYSERLRLWQFLEDELKTTVMASASYQHKFKEAGHVLNTGVNYTFHREDEKYFFDNILPASTGRDAFKLLSDENVLDVNIDYIKPLSSGRFEAGFKFRNRIIPTNMQFYPGQNSVIDADAGGKATYEESIPAVYGNYIYETNLIEAEAGVRVEYLDLEYEVNPNHPVYRTDGYHYLEPFPSLRFAYKLNDNHKLSLFYNRRVDRPNEVDIRIFPKYDDAEIIKVGNPGLRPQFTNTAELGYKTNFEKGYFFASAYYKQVEGTITRIATTTPGSTLIYNVFENASKSKMMGSEVMFSYKATSWYSFNLNATLYRNTIDGYSVDILYPEPTNYSATKQQITSGNVKWNNTFTFSSTLTGQLMAAYLAPDIIPQGKTLGRFSTDIGLKKVIQKGKGELFLNATDLFNTLVIRKEVQGNGFSYISKDYYETQVVRFGYSYKF